MGYVSAAVCFNPSIQKRPKTDSVRAAKCFHHEEKGKKIKRHIISWKCKQLRETAHSVFKQFSYGSSR